AGRVRVAADGSPSVEAPVVASASADANDEPTAAPSARHWAWAALMRRAFDIDVLACPRCGGRLRLIATVEDPDAIRAILAVVAVSRKVAGRAPPFAAPRDISQTAAISAEHHSGAAQAEACRSTAERACPRCIGGAEPPVFGGRSGGSDPLGQAREGLDEMAASEKRVFRQERAFIPSMLHRVDALAVDVLAARPRYFF